MSQAKKGISYKDFIKLPLQQRQCQSKYLLENNPKFIPVILASTSTQLPELKNCKFLIEEENQLLIVMAELRSHIKLKINLSKQEQLFLYVKSKILNPNEKSKDLYAKIKNELQDGWLLITYQKQAVFGALQENPTQF